MWTQGNNVSDSSTSLAERKDISSLRRTLAAFETWKLNGNRVVDFGWFEGFPMLSQFPQFPLDSLTWFRMSMAELQVS